ncbi:MAG: hypothetical protein R2780_13175 [Crocinitomicaceae bacterium]|nr:hypothetical protein [Crocinitomicaceae bacterium]
MKAIVSLGLALLLTACYMSKSLDKEVHVSIDPNIPVSIFNNGNSNFSAAGTEADYQQKFIEGMKAEFSSSQVVVDDANPEFNVRITELLITESTSTETVSDTTSEQNGMTFELTKLDYQAKGTLTRLKDNVVYNWSASKDDEEKVKSNRTVIQLATGGNKERNEYREKEFSSNEAVDLAWNIGRRAGNSVVKEIQRSLK